VTRLSELLDRYESPKIVAGPFASPSARGAREAIAQDPDYQELRTRLARAGVFAPAPWSYAWRGLVLVASFAAGFAYLSTAPPVIAQLATALVLGLVHTWCNFFAHDLSHGAVSKRPQITNALGQLFDSFLTGFSFSYFRRSHTLHHYHCNEDGYDPDTMSGLWSFSAKSARSKRGFGRATSRVQHQIIPYLYVLWGGALKLQGFAYVLRNPRAALADAALLVLHFAGWTWLATRVGVGMAVIDYLLMTMVVGAYLGLIFPVGHVGTPILEPGPRRFLTHQLATTRNVTSNPVRDTLFMGLNSQIEHHLFPWVPSMRLARARGLVKAFCRERGLPYFESEHREAIAEVSRHLRHMARFVDHG
jgi:fatty acid desaturase